MNWFVLITLVVLRLWHPVTPVRHYQTSHLTVTAYCATGSRTASGVEPEVGMAAGNHWPFGTRIHVPHWGIVRVTDRIGYGSDLDLFMDSCQQAEQWGRRTLTVEVLN